MRRAVAWVCAACALHLAGAGRAEDAPSAPASGASSKPDVHILQGACDENDLQACVRLGEMFETGSEGVSKDEKRAFRLFNRACEGGSVPGCGCLGRVYLNATGVRKNPAKARSLLEHACEQGYARACRGLGKVYFEGMGVPVNKARATGIWEKACDGGDLVSCANQGNSYFNGTGVTVNKARAAGIWEKACDGGDLVSCMNLGVIVVSGAEGVPKDEARARALYKRACSAGVALACSNLGVVYMDGQGVAADASIAALYFEKACIENLGDACHAAVVMHVRAEHRPDQYQFERLLRRACELGSQVGCEDLGKNYPGTAQIVAWRRACELGNQRRCDDLRKHYPGEAESLARSPRPKSRPRSDYEERTLRDRLLGP